MKPATKRLVSILISLVFLVGAVILFTSLVLPAYRTIQELRGEKSALAAVFEKEEKLVKAAGRLLNEYQNARDVRDTLSLVLPTEEATSGIINQVQGIAKTTGVAVDGINVEAAPLEFQDTGSVAEPVGILKITVRLRGSYEGLRSYIQSIETNVRIIDVDSFVVVGGSTKDPLSANLVIRTYYQR
ncbi:MAG: type 4a pilus biogenesis protein PilO [Candidatus Colwellbacteria bacterium]|nr:type 4a pilus biogenesis protein PilO [Candidatus Colwellbacteria bacterium]